MKKVILMIVGVLLALGLVMESSAMINNDYSLHVVKKGECFWTIAEGIVQEQAPSIDKDHQIYLVDAVKDWIVEVNKGKLQDPDLIYPRERYLIPSVQLVLKKQLADKKEKLVEIKANYAALETEINTLETTIEEIKIVSSTTTEIGITSASTAIEGIVVPEIGAEKLTSATTDTQLGKEATSTSTTVMVKQITPASVVIAGLRTERNETLAGLKTWKNLAIGFLMLFIVAVVVAVLFWFLYIKKKQKMEEQRTVRDYVAVRLENDNGVVKFRIVKIEEDENGDILIVGKCPFCGARVNEKNWKSHAGKECPNSPFSEKVE